MQKQYKFYESKVKLTLISFLMLAVVIFLSFIIFSILGSSDKDIFPLVFMSLTNLFLLFILIFVLPKRIFSKEPVIILTDEGFKSYFIGNILIPWNDIEGFLPYTYQNQPYIGVIVKDEDKYLNLLTNTQQKLSKINMNMGLPPFNIVVTSLKEKPQELFEKLSEFDVSFLVKEE